MRTIPILTVAAIAIASTGAAYYFLRDNASAKQAEEAIPSISSLSTLDMQDTPIRDGRGDQPVSPEQPRLTLSQEKVAALEARLRYLETAAREQAKDQPVSRPDPPDANNGTENQKRQSFQKPISVSGWTKLWTRGTSTARRPSWSWIKRKKT